MKAISMVIAVALIFGWVAPIAAAQPQTETLPYEAPLEWNENPEPLVIAIGTVLMVHLVVWGVFTISVRIHRRFHRNESGSLPDVYPSDTGMVTAAAS